MTNGKEKVIWEIRVHQWAVGSIPEKWIPYMFCETEEEAEKEYEKASRMINFVEPEPGEDPVPYLRYVDGIDLQKRVVGKQLIEPDYIYPEDCVRP